MVITPNSRIRLLKSPIELDERNQLTFANLTAQTNYFLSLPYLEYDECTYQRKDGVIRYKTGEGTNITYEDLLKYNYCMYQNTAYDTKWFYAFITDVKYVNDGCTELKIETDVIETWKFEINYKPSFIEREHTNDDTIGANVVPEGLNTGEYVIDNEGTIQIDTLFVPCAAVTTKPYNPLTDNPDAPLFVPYNGIFAGTKYIVSDTIAHFGELIQYYNNLGIADRAIETIFMIPKYIADGATIQTITYGTISIYWGEIPTSNSSYGASTIPRNKPTTLNGYTPKNKKCLTYPYCYVNVDNNVGSITELHYEDFSGTVYGFSWEQNINPGCSLKIYPWNYKGLASNYMYSIAGAKLPICSFGSDIYTSWVLENSANLATDTALGFINAMNTDYPVNFLGNIFRSVAQAQNIRALPNTVKGNASNGDVNFSMGLSNPKIYEMSIKASNARIVDDYFSMFGYKTNRIKTPNIEGRTNWNYVKTIGLNITGDIPQSDMQKIKDIFDSGITFWHNPSTFLDYSQSNGIVS